MFCEVYQFSGANESEVSGIEEEDAPFSSNVFAADGFELAVVVGFYLKFGGFSVDDWLQIEMILFVCLGISQGWSASRCVVAMLLTACECFRG